MKIKQSESREFVQPKTGLTQAIVNRIIDLGTQEDTFEGKTNLRRKVMIEFALPKQTHTFEEQEGPQMLTISRFFTMSLNKKGALRPFIEGMTGKAVNEEDFDTKNLLNLNCMVNIMEHEKANGDKGTKIASVSPLMEGLDPVQAPDGYEFSLDEWNSTVFGVLSEGIQNMIKLSPEYKEIAENPLID